MAMMALAVACVANAQITTSPSLGDETDHISTGGLIFPGTDVRYAKEAIGTARGVTAPSDAPNPVSPAWGSYVTNAMTIGIPEWKTAGTGPSQFRLLTPTDVGTPEMLTQTAAPLTVGGKSVRFPVRFPKGSSPYLLSTLRGKYKSSDPGNLLGFEADFATNNHSASRPGYQHTATGIVRVASGPGTTPTDEQHYIGLGNGFVARSSIDEQTIREIIANNPNFVVGAQYTINTVDGREVRVESELSFTDRPTTLMLSGSASGKAILVISSGFPGNYRIDRASALRGPYQEAFTLVKDSLNDVPSAVVSLSGSTGFFRILRVP